MGSEQAVSPELLAQVLRDFGKTPGLYPVRLGEPRELFQQLDTVAQWALGRLPPELQEHAQALSAAAVLFVQRACFGQDPTHYQVLGLTPHTCTADNLRARYRAMIRLTHPDMGVPGLPANAAGMVNRAQEVLNDPELRRQYDEQLARQAARPHAAEGRHVTMRRVEHRHSWRDRWHDLMARHPKLLQAGLAGGGMLGLGLATMMWAAQDDTPSRMLVVARAPQAAQPATEVPVVVQTAITPQQDVPALPIMRPPVQTEQPAARVATVAPAPAMGVPPPVTPTPMPAPSLVSAPATQPVPALQPSPAKVVEQTVVAKQETPAAAPPPPMVATPTPVATATTSPPPVPSAPAEPAWSVDATGAKQYLTSVVSTFTRPVDARQLNAYLADMRIKGSLLQPVLRLQREYPQIHLEQQGWTQTERPGALSLQAGLLLYAKGPADGEIKTLRLRLQADFQGTKEGTVLSRLDLKENE